MANKLTKLTNEDKNRVLSGTSYVLPNNPSNKGWTADQIRQKGYQGLIAMFDLINTKFQAIIDDLNERVLNNDFGEFQTEITNNLNQINSSFSTINTDITNLKNGVSENTSTITSNYNELTTRVNDLYYQLSKVSTDTFPTRDEVNSEIGRLTSLINSAIEVANGKTATYVLSYNFYIPSDEEFENTLGVYYDGNGYEIKSRQDLLNYLGTGWSLTDLVNSNFNSQDDSISFYSNGGTGDYGFIAVENKDKITFIKLVETATCYLNTGDIILVIEPNVPDRWVSYTRGYKMETTKVDLSTVVHLDGQEDITGIKNFTNGIKIGNSPITFNNNELQVVNDIVGLEGKNLGSQTQPFNKLYAKYFNDGSGNEAMLSELMPKVLEVSIDMDLSQLQQAVNGDSSIDYVADDKLNVRSFILAQQGIIKLTINTPAGSLYMTLRPSLWKDDTAHSYNFEGNLLIETDLTAIGGTGFNQIIVRGIAWDTNNYVDFRATILPIIDYYTKTQIDTNYYTKTEVDNAIQNAIGNVLNGDF